MRTCPHEPQDRLLLSGTKLRKMLSEGDEVPDTFSRPEVLAILREYYEGLSAEENVTVELKGHSGHEGHSVDDVVDGRLLQLPLARVPVVARDGEAVPVGVVQLRVVGPVVVARPPRLGAEHRMVGHRLRCQDPMVELPRPLKLVEVLGGEVVQVFP